MKTADNSPFEKLLAQKKTTLEALNKEGEKINSSLNYFGQNYRSLIIYGVKKVIFPAEKEEKEQNKNEFLHTVKKILLPLMLNFAIGQIMSFLQRKTNNTYEES